MDRNSWCCIATQEQGSRGVAVTYSRLFNWYSPTWFPRLTVPFGLFIQRSTAISWATWRCWCRGSSVPRTSTWRRSMAARSPAEAWWSISRSGHKGGATLSTNRPGYALNRHLFARWTLGLIYTHLNPTDFYIFFMQCLTSLLTYCIVYLCLFSGVHQDIPGRGAAAS